MYRVKVLCCDDSFIDFVVKVVLLVFVIVGCLLKLIKVDLVWFLVVWLIVFVVLGCILLLWL